MAIGAFEVLQSAILEVASSLDESGGALPGGRPESWYRALCEMYRPTEIAIVEEYLKADQRTWLLCKVTGFMYLPEVFDRLLLQVKADFQAAGIDLDEEPDGDGPPSD